MLSPFDSLETEAFLCGIWPVTSTPFSSEVRQAATPKQTISKTAVTSISTD
jgi:hypothetical protein